LSAAGLGWLANPVGPVVVDLKRCIRCGGCSIIAPQLFSVAGKATGVVRQPETDAERRAARAAALTCPTQAIGGAE